MKVPSPMKKIFFLFTAAIGALTLFAGESGAASESMELPTRMLFLTLQIGLILFVAKLGGMLAALCKMPSVLGELAAGVAIGPYALGGIAIGSGIFAHGFFPLPATGGSLPVTNELYGICTIASVILLFLSGVETNLKMFLRYSVVGSFVGLGGVITSFLFGDLCAVYLPQLMPELLKNYQNLTPFSAEALFLGIMCTATSVGITARILSERKAMDTEEGVTIMAGAVVDDVLGIIVLAIGMGVIEANSSASGSGGTTAAAINWGTICKVAMQAFGVWLGGTVFGILLARKISWLLKLFKSPVAVATLAFGLSLVIAGLFEALGLTLIIGAYVMGLALSRTDIRYLIQENLQSVYTFLVPIFFCVMGMMVDCSKLTSKPVLIFGCIYTVLAILAKIIGCSIPSLFCGFNILGSLRVGAGMIPRGEVALIIAGIGLSKGYLPPEVFGIGILMTLITTVVAPPMLVGLFDIKRKGVRHPRASTDGSRPFSFTLPNPASAEYMLEKLIHAFRSEGFYTNLLNPQDNIWAISKDDVEISMSLHGEKISFECTPAEETFVTTACLEVAGDMRALAHDLATPVRRNDVATILNHEESQEGPIARGPSAVTRYLHSFVMIPHLAATTKKELIEKMVYAIAEANPSSISNVEAVLDAVFKREESMPTGLDHGIAVPHGRTDAVTGIIGAVALIDQDGTAGAGVTDYETIDHSAVRIVVLTLAAETNQQTPYLQLMAYISRRLHQNNGSEALKKCRSAEEMMKFFRMGK